MDPLSDVLSLLHTKAHLSARFEGGEKWAVCFPSESHIKFGTALKGGFWLTLSGAEPRRIEEGDTYLLTRIPTYVLSTDPTLPAVDGHELYAAARDNRVHYGGNDIVILGGSFSFDDRNATLLLEGLPSLIIIPGNKPYAASVMGTLLLLDKELREFHIGAPLVSGRLGDILLVQALRAHVASGATIGWLGALGHPKLNAALRLIHGEVARDWTVGELAKMTGMSRSDFARKFRERIGMPPMVYLTRWRMHLAREALLRNDTTLTIIAASVGYSSESAFGHAFKRWFGCSPKRYWPNIQN